MNIELLKTFLEVAKTRHFGHAAENLFVTQSAVSARIRQLEEVLGTALFSRQRNNILLTAAGERLLGHAENLLSAWQLTMQEVGVPTAQSTQLALGGTPNLWEAFQSHLLPKVASAFPRLYVRAEVNQPQNLVRGLLGGRLDMFTSCDPPVYSGLDSSVIGRLELVMVCNQPGQTPATLPKLGHVFVDWGASVNLHQAKLFTDASPPRLHTAQSRIALDFILAYTGAAYLPRLSVDTYLTGERLFEVAEVPAITQSVHIVYPQGACQREDHGPIIECIKEMTVMG